MTKHKEIKIKIAERDNFCCQKCGKYLGFNGCLADRISQSKMNRKKFGNHIIDHPFNKVYTCITNECNDSFNIGMNPMKSERLRKFIFTSGTVDVDSKTITEWIED